MANNLPLTVIREQVPNIDLEQMHSVPSEQMPGWEYAEDFQILSTTGLATFARCPRKFFYQHVCNLTTASEALPLKFGEAIHKALPDVLVHSDLVKALASFSSIWGDRDRYDDDKRNTAVAYRILEHAKTVHSKTAPYPIYEMLPPPITNMTVGEDKSDYEIPFVLQIPGSRFLLGSRIDGLCRHVATGQEWGLEFKTASSLSSWTLDSFELNPQIMLYTLALRVLYKASIPGSLLHAFYVSKSVSKTVPESIVKPIDVAPNVLDDFIRWTIFTAQMIQLYIDNRNFPKQYAGCSPYGMFGVPGGVCPFRSACKVPDWTQVIGAYAKSDYKPFKLAAEQALETPVDTEAATWEPNNNGGAIIKL